MPPLAHAPDRLAKPLLLVLLMLVSIVLPLAPVSAINSTLYQGAQAGSIYENATLATGSSHTCAILDDGSIRCWGYNSYGQLGDGTNTNRNTPTALPGWPSGRTAVAIAAGDHTCAILDDGSVRCWGRNDKGQLGDGTNTDKNTPTASSNLPSGRTAVAISVGGATTCAILDDGSVRCWGWNNNGQLGDGTNTDRNTPTALSGWPSGRTAVALAAGYHTCAILDDGSVRCWGDNYAGQLGDGTNTDKNTPTSLSNWPAGRTAVALAAGGSHTCAILDEGSVRCWGWNGNGQLGDGTNTAKNTPTALSNWPSGRTAVALAAGYFYTCTILDDGSVLCWGSNSYGQLGDGTNTDKNTPTASSNLPSGRTAIAFAVGWTHTCAILDDGSVRCWGWNNNGQLGDGTTTDRYNTPKLVSVPLNTPALATGSSHTCAILDDGSVRCWGWNNRGQLGDGTNTDKNTPTSLSNWPAGRTAVALAAGGSHTCATLDDGSVRCWGDNYAGQLGDGTTTDRNTPTALPGWPSGRTAVALAAGGGHTCAILDDGSVRCWGSNGNGQLGDDTTTNRNTPTALSGWPSGRTAVALAASQYHTCSILDDGSVRCWGGNSGGQLGDGTNTDRTTPTALSGWPSGRTAVALAAGGLHSCAILDDGSVRCWGWNNRGQLGDGTGSGKNTPTALPGWPSGRTAVALAGGGFHTCATLDDGSVRCWGSNTDGQQGDGTTTDRDTPTALSGWPSGRTAVALATGGYHTCAILDDGSVLCWGRNSAGQLGDGTITNRNTPTGVNTIAQFRLWPSAVGDRDNDDDGLLNIFDRCPNGMTGWTSPSINDPDGDGCLNSEDDDDDDDGVLDVNDDCATGDLNWTASAATDHDGDGCRDVDEDLNDDNDPKFDNEDDCALGEVGWTVTDWDGDGCRDESEDPDDDNDGICDNDGSSPGICNSGPDLCAETPLGETTNADGCGMQTQLDTDGDGVYDANDACVNEPALSGYDNDMDGCTDDTDGDGVTDDLDVFPDEPTQWSDRDGDTWGDNPSGNRPDQCQDTPAQWVLLARDRFGCAWEEEDADSDGVVNGYDDCPDTETGREVDASGCPQWQIDDDGDGVFNALDNCADTPAGESVDVDGCSTSQLDTDSDGVSDADDACPGFNDSVDVDADGIPDGCDSLIDSDGDGVADSSDACPGFNDSVDADADGIPDGCDPLVDSDADGVADADDACADTMVGTDVDPTGCAIQAEGETQAESSSRTEQLLMAVVALLVLLILVVGVSMLLRRRPEEPEATPEGSVPAQSKPADSPVFDSAASSPPPPKKAKAAVKAPASAGSPEAAPGYDYEHLLSQGWTAQQIEWHRQEQAMQAGSSRPSPRIDMTAQTTQPVHVCTLCQGRIKQADMMHACQGCGKPFHLSCAERIPTCPQCGTPT